MINASKYPVISGVKEAKVKEEELFMCLPTLYGFDFGSNEWGHLSVELLDGISLIF